MATPTEKDRERAIDLLEHAAVTGGWDFVSVRMKEAMAQALADERERALRVVADDLDRRSCLKIPGGGFIEPTMYQSAARIVRKFIENGAQPLEGAETVSMDLEGDLPTEQEMKDTFSGGRAGGDPCSNCTDCMGNACEHWEHARRMEERAAEQGGS